MPQERGYRVWDTIWRRRPWDTSTWSQDSPPGGHRDHQAVIGKCTSTPPVDSSNPSPRTLPFSFCLSVFCCLLAANVALDQVPQSRALFCHLLFFLLLIIATHSAVPRYQCFYFSSFYSIFSADYWSIAVGGFMLLWRKSAQKNNTQCVQSSAAQPVLSRAISASLYTRALHKSGPAVGPRWSGRPRKTGFYDSAGSLGRNSIGNQFDIHKSQLLRRGCSAKKRASHQINSKNAQDSGYHTFLKSTHSHIQTRNSHIFL